MFQRTFRGLARKPVVATVAAAAALAILGVGSCATAPDGGEGQRTGDDQTGELDREWQEGVASYTRAVNRIANRQPNFSGSSFDNENKTFIVFGVGEPSAELLKIFDRAPSEVQLDWRETDYTERELLSQMRLVDISRYGLSGVAIADEFDGIVVMYPSSDRLAEAREASKDVTVPVDFVEQPPPVALGG